MVIYEIKNLVNGKVYIGQTIQEANQRWLEHVSTSRSDKNHPLYNSMRKHGTDNFSFTVIDTASSIEELNEKERSHLAKARTIGDVYNIREAGDNKTHSEASIERMRVAQRAAHARRRAEGRDGGWTRIDGGAMLGKVHPAKGKKRSV